ncbi:hypothetical protein [Neomegalonema sp.]|uniref:hypothetical protein n=1 Tax=Neomegalonema sp. TaxID=2039713 RepID=UPI0026182456|nr:hypothetical protein [Neomegalonema sp.]MDD2870035.1 hypothetical protein [Neomegalonema sp.]
MTRPQVRPPAEEDSPAGGSSGAHVVRRRDARMIASGVPGVCRPIHEADAAARRLYDQVAERSGFLHYRRNLI